ncbi:MAG: hypothetical protein JW763_06195 [candidate division Zixibacteria bacterium]|nr:hypothetical protein [candidate division Zixibacteria bacterium]
MTHLGALVIPVGYYLLGRTVSLAVLIPVTIAMIIIDVGRLRDWRVWHAVKWFIRPMIRHNEQEGADFTGATYILTTACAVIAMYSPSVVVAALVFIIMGDPAAVLIGKSCGRHYYGRKTIEGSLGFLAMAVLVALVVPGLPRTVSLIGAVVATVTEGLSTKIDDNTSVPLISGLAMQLLLATGWF